MVIRHAKQPLTAQAMLFIAFLVLYVATLCPTVYLGDSGEIATAIWANGIIHPPGYPLFALLGRLALKIIPVGEPAFKIGIIAAIAGAATVANIHTIAQRLGATTLPAAAAAATFGLTTLAWSQANRVEVYSLHLALLTTALDQAIAYRNTAKQAHLSAAALAFTLGIAHHLTIIWTLPTLVLIAAPPLFDKKERLPRLIKTALLIVTVGPAFYALLPLWANDSSLHNWGDPKTPHNFWTHVSARLYQDRLRLPHTLGAWSTALTLARQVLAENWVWPLWIGAGAGFVVLARREKRLAFALGLLAALVGVYNCCYTIDDIASYYLPVFLVATLALAQALTVVESKLQPRKLATAAVLLAAPLWLLLTSWQKCDLHAATGARTMGMAKLVCAERDSVLLTGEENDVSTLNYVHEVLGVRPDVLTIDRGALSFSIADGTEWYLRALIQKGIPKEAFETTRAALSHDDFIYDGALMQLLDGPLREKKLATTFLGVVPVGDPGRIIVWFKAKKQMTPRGLIVALAPLDKPIPIQDALSFCSDFWAHTELPTMPQGVNHVEMDAEYLQKHYVAMLTNYGYLYEITQQPQKAEAVYTVALQWAPQIAQKTLSKMKNSAVAQALIDKEKHR